MIIIKDVVGYEGLYTISSDGVLRNKKGLVKKTQKSQRGHSCTTLSKNGKKFNTFIHRILATAFIPNPNNLPQVNHIDGVRDNNELSNLEWCTGSENIRHAHATGLSVGLLGEINHFSKLTEKQVLEIRKKGKYSTWRQMAIDYKMSDTAIVEIIKRKTWKHI